jgi:hypothetical protein
VSKKLQRRLLMPSVPETTIARRIFVWGGYSIGAITMLIVLMVEIIWLEQQAKDYRASIVRDTVEALNHAKH